MLYCLSHDINIFTNDTNRHSLGIAKTITMFCKLISILFIAFANDHILNCRTSGGYIIRNTKEFAKLKGFTDIYMFIDLI